jgi:thioesterase domain-containing protein
VQDMSPDQPVYGFVARGFDGLRAPHRSVREMARDYILELKRVQPTGPYFLGGICLGCLVAAEMAAQLLEAGDTVAPLSFVVPRHPPTSWEVFLELNPVGKVFRHLSRLREVPASEQLRYLWFRVRNAPKRLINPLPTVGTSDINFRTAHLHALLSHRVRSMNLRGIFLMDAAQHRGRWAQQWAPLLRGGIQPILIAGDHHSSLREYSMETARHLQQAVDQAAHTLQHPEARA